LHEPRSRNEQGKEGRTYKPIGRGERPLPDLELDLVQISAGDLGALQANQRGIIEGPCEKAFIHG